MPRQLHFDGLRGLAVLLMVMVHIAATWNPYGTDQTSLLAYVVSGLGGLAAPLFVTLFGWAAALRPLSAGQRFVRASVLLFFQLVVNLSAPHLFDPFTPGVLSLFAILVVLQPLWLAPVRSPRPFTWAAVGLCISVAFAWGSPDWMGSVQWDQRIAVTSLTGWMAHMVFTGTYPLFPWVMFAVLGSCLQHGDPRVNSRALGVLAGTGVAVSAVLLSISLRTSTSWALPSGEAYLTFFPANGPFLLAALAGVSIIWAWCLQWPALFDKLAPVGRMSLTVYVGHFLPLAYIHEWDSELNWSLTVAIAAAFAYTFAWGTLAWWWFKRAPLMTLEHLMRRIEKSMVARKERSRSRGADDIR